MKYAIEFRIEIISSGLMKFYDPVLVSEAHYLAEQFEFEYDYFDWWKDSDNTPELRDLPPSIYHVFEYGTFSEDWSNNWETGREFDGFIFEPEHTRIIEIKG